MTPELEKIIKDKMWSIAQPNGFSAVERMRFTQGMKAALTPEVLIHVPEVAKLLKHFDNIIKYNFRGSGPGGCDSHCINHPCGPCVDLPNEKWIAKQALEPWGEYLEGEI